MPTPPAELLKFALSVSGARRLGLAAATSTRPAAYLANAIASAQGTAFEVAVTGARVASAAVRATLRNSPSFCRSEVGSAAGIELLWKGLESAPLEEVEF